MCNRGVSFHPHTTIGRIVLGRCFMKQELWAEAVGVFTEVCRLDPRNTIAIKLLGDLFARQGSSARAGDLYRLVAAMDPFDTTMAAVAARAVGSGKTELSDILAEVAEGAKGSALTDVASMAESSEESKNTAPGEANSVDTALPSPKSSEIRMVWKSPPLGSIPYSAMQLPRTWLLIKPTPIFRPGRLCRKVA